VRRDALGHLIDAYIGKHDPHLPLLSPLYADLRGLPPLLIQVGTNEMLLPSVQEFAERARKAGVEVTLEVWEGMWHVWQITTPLVPEATSAVKRIGLFVEQHLGRRAECQQ
jgi:epsilon-lactone hydrolase